jgi:sec-independent protein translocase protein TatB
MFGVDTTELLIIALAALVFIGPKELPGAMRTVGRWIGRARAHARHFTAGIENMMREAELEEMEKRWREENERIMRDHPVAAPYVGAPEVASGSSTAIGMSGEASLPSPDAHAPPTATLTDEPALPLPEPEHHKRDLP